MAAQVHNHNFEMGPAACGRRLTLPGFTLIEVLAAITIIAILIGMLTLGISSMMKASNKNATRLILQNADGMLEEWQRGFGANSSAAIVPSQPWPNAFLPGDLRQIDRDSNPVRLARGCMFRLKQNSAVKQMLLKLPSDRFYMPAVPNSQAYASGSVALGYECVASGANYICYSVPAVDPISGANPTNYWLRTTADTPVLLDAWNNPILQIPSCGFVVQNGSTYRLLTSAGAFTLPAVAGNNPSWGNTYSYQPGDIVAYPGGGLGPGVWGIYRCINAASGNAQDPSHTVYWTQIPTRSYFASAGPDGNFAATDDNIYSFER